MASKKRHHVTYNSCDRDGAFRVQTDKDKVEFVPHESELHYLDLKSHKDVIMALVTAIREKFEGYTKRQVIGFNKECCLQAMLGHKSRKDFESMVHANLIANCPVTPENITHVFTTDIMFVNNWSFVITPGRGIWLIMV